MTLSPDSAEQGSRPLAAGGQDKFCDGPAAHPHLDAYGRALNFWEPPSSDTATGTKANTWSQAAVSAEGSAPHRLACDLPKVGGAMLQVPVKTWAGLDRKRERTRQGPRADPELDLTNLGKGQLLGGR